MIVGHLMIESPLVKFLEMQPGTDIDRSSLSTSKDRLTVETFYHVVNAAIAVSAEIQTLG